MKRYILHKLLILLGILLLVSCRQDDSAQTAGTASLQLNIKALENTLQTRGVEDLDDDGTVSEEERIVDGRKMYRLSVFLLDGNTVIASTELEADDQRFGKSNTEATVSFDNLDYTKTYKLYVVANYGTYNGLTGKLSEVTAGNMTVSASNDKLCDKNTPYPLTLAKDISLSPGVNNIGGELVRTYARIRINVCNQSSTNDLYISNLSFPAKFTQNSVDIFTEGGTANAQPMVASADAITPFVANTMIPKMDSESNVSEKTIFDSYLLESTGGDYKYTLGVEYKDDDKVGSEIGRKYGIINGGLYLIKSVYGDNVYLCDNGANTVGLGNAYSNGKLNSDYVWKVTRLEDDNCIFQSMKGRYMQISQMNENAIPLGESTGNNYLKAIDISWNNNWGLIFQRGNNGSYYYLSTANGKACGQKESTREFVLYQVTTSSILREVTTPISIIDKNTGEASLLTAIKRNDFINILVNVTYNEKTGEVQFEVANWDEVNGEVEFD